MLGVGNRAEDLKGREISYRRPGDGPGENRSTTSRNESGLSGPYGMHEICAGNQRLAIVQIWRGLSSHGRGRRLHCSLSLEAYVLVRFGCRIWKPGADPVETTTKRKGGLHTYRPVIAPYTVKVGNESIRQACMLAVQVYLRWYLGRPKTLVCFELTSPIAGQDVGCQAGVFLSNSRGLILGSRFTHYGLAKAVTDMDLVELNQGDKRHSRPGGFQAAGEVPQ